jgi:hypothetical protein
MDQEKIIEYLRRSFSAVDGLWFMMIEKEFSFNKALEIDKSVWGVLPKIQARKLKELLGLNGIGLSDLLQAIKARFEAEEYSYEVLIEEPDHVQIAINKCPWYEILKKTKREHLAPKLIDAICSTEFKVWGKEFGENIDFGIEYQNCTDKCSCALDFRHRK